MTTTFPRIRCDLRRMGVGKVQMSTRAKTEREHNRRVTLFYDLVEQGQVALLKALVAGTLSWEDLVDHRRRNHGRVGADALGDVALHQEVWEAVPAIVPTMGKRKSTRNRYALSLRTAEALGDGVWPAIPLRVRDLETVVWAGVRAAWPAESASDWNHLGRAVRRFLRLYLGDESTFPRRVMKRFPWEVETERVPDLTPDVFWRVMAASPEALRPVWMTLVVTGMRVRSEYLRCAASDLMPNLPAVKVPGTKTAKSLGVVAVHRSLWKWVEAAVPSPLRYKWLRIHWCRACVAAGAGSWTEPDEERGYSGLHMHDLRHALGQWATDQGVPTAVVQDQLRHQTEAMTRRYSRMTNARQVADAIGVTLLSPEEKTG
jgi:integrase